MTNKITYLDDGEFCIVKKDEVDKFIRDISKNEYNGIFISQHSGIVGKNNFQIDIHDKHILIYIHSCDYDIDKITETENDVHAGEVETSTSLATRPNLVKMELANILVYDEKFNRAILYYAQVEENLKI